MWALASYYRVVKKLQRCVKPTLERDRRTGGQTDIIAICYINIAPFARQHDVVDARY